MKQNSFYNQLRGFILHLFYWLVYPDQDIEYPNPRFDPATVKPGRKGTVLIMIHGMADYPAAYLDMIKNLINDLSPNIKCIKAISFSKGYFLNSVEECSEALHQKIQTTNETDLILMGHSRGGIIAAYYAEYIAKKSINKIEIKSIITICSPFKGAYLAHFIPKKFSIAISQLRPGSQFLCNLSHQLVNSNYYYHSIASEDDWIVPPKLAYSGLKNAQLMIFEKQGHLSIMHSKDLFAYLRALMLLSV